MAKRIVKQTLSNGKVQYAIESNEIIGKLCIPGYYYQETIELDEGILVGAVFSTLEEAKRHLECQDVKITKREVVYDTRRVCEIGKEKRNRT